MHRKTFFCKKRNQVFTLIQYTFLNLLNSILSKAYVENVATLTEEVVLITSTHPCVHYVLDQMTKNLSIFWFSSIEDARSSRCCRGAVNINDERIFIVTLYFD